MSVRDVARQDCHASFDGDRGAGPLIEPSAAGRHCRLMTPAYELVALRRAPLATGSTGTWFRTLPAASTGRSYCLPVGDALVILGSGETSKLSTTHTSERDE